MTDYLNPSHIVPPANQCVSCGAEMGEGDMVCPACISTTQESLQVERQKGCDWCKHSILPFTMMADDRANRTLHLKENYKPKYCPECGRKLGEGV